MQWIQIKVVQLILFRIFLLLHNFNVWIFFISKSNLVWRIWVQGRGFHIPFNFKDIAIFKHILERIIGIAILLGREKVGIALAILGCIEIVGLILNRHALALMNHQGVYLILIIGVCTILVSKLLIWIWLWETLLVVKQVWLWLLVILLSLIVE